MSTPTATADEPTRSPANRPLLRGAAAGLLAYLLGYAGLYLWKAREVESALSGLNALVSFFGGDGIPTWKAVGWLFYDAHNVALQIPSGDGAASRHLIGGEGNLTVLYALPPLLLLAGGFLAAYTADVGTPKRGAAAGASVAVGYVVLAVAGAFVTSVDAFGSSVGPGLLTAALLAGVAYPVVFGGLGGLVAAVVAE